VGFNLVRRWTEARATEPPVAEKSASSE